MSIKDAYTAEELAPLLDYGSERNVRIRAKREGWQSRPRSGRGGGHEWLVASMPEKTRLTLAAALPPFRETPESAATALFPVLSGAGAPLNTAPLKNLSESARATVVARLAFVREVERMCLVGTRGAAISSLVLASAEGTLSPRLAGLVPLANARFGAGTRRGLSRRRLYDWCAAYDAQGEAGLIPANPRKQMTPPAWLQLFLMLWQRPQKPSVAQAYDEFKAAWASILRGTAKGLVLPVALKLSELQQMALNIAAEAETDTPPSIYAVRRWLGKMSMPEREAGRRTGNALLSLRPHKLRITEHLLPTDVYTADGTTADVEVLNPDTGKPFKPELTFVVDVATRRVVGVSVGLAENRYVILDALRMACNACGIPAIFYTDNGPGYENRLMSAPGTGMMDRLGIDIARSIPGRPQGKGLMERAVQTLTKRLCKQFASCTDAEMDPDAAHNVFKLSRKDIQKTGTTRLCPTWAEFLAALKERVRVYNATPHSALPKVRDASGRLCRQSPDDRWRMFEAQGWEPVRVPDYLHDELFMPGELRYARNGSVRLFNVTYFSAALADWHGERVQVRYDIWNASRVLVLTRDDRFICAAEAEGNAMPYFPQPRVEAARAKRKTAEILRLERKAQAAVPGAHISLPDGAAGAPVDVADSLARGSDLPGTVNNAPKEQQDVPPLREWMPEPVEKPAPARKARPIFPFEADRYEYLMRHPEVWIDGDDDAFMARYTQSGQYRDFEESYKIMGIAWEGHKTEVKSCANVS